MDEQPARKPSRPAFDDVSDVRRRNMAAIRGKNTTPEVLVRRLLHSIGYRFRLHRRDLPGRPDIVFPARRKAIEVRGCFWHRHPGCRFASVPAKRADFWNKKFALNVARDARNQGLLEAAGWEVLVVWECEVPDRELTGKLTEFLDQPGHGKRA